jgi:Flp pilus assembly pilin Flp
MKYKEKTMLPLIARGKTFIRDEEAATAVEYALILGGIALVVVAAIYALGQALNVNFSLFQNTFGN